MSDDVARLREVRSNKGDYLKKCEVCEVCGWPLSVMPKGLVCLNAPNHPVAVLDDGKTTQ